MKSSLFHHHRHHLQRPAGHLRHLPASFFQLLVFSSFFLASVGNFTRNSNKCFRSGEFKKKKKGGKKRGGNSHSQENVGILRCGRKKGLSEELEENGGKVG